MVNPVRRLELVHFQITKQCNLRCWFCGQWGKQGAFSARHEKELGQEDWMEIIHQLEDWRQKTGDNPSVLLWGGEPTLSPVFRPVAETLFEKNFPLAMVTNGTLLDRHIDLCKKAFRCIYISVDGTPALHDAVRGKGTFQKISDNLRLLAGGNAKVIIMTVLTEQVQNQLEAVLNSFLDLHPDQVLLQELISMDKREAGEYQTWLEKTFGQTAERVMSWVGPSTKHVPHSWYSQWIKEHPYPFEVQHLPHGREAFRPYCLSPLRHLHIAWDGSVGFCTDFTDFSLGNVRERNVMEMFTSKRAEIFAEEVRQGHCITCEHCSWKNSQMFGI